MLYPIWQKTITINKERVSLQFKTEDGTVQALNPFLIKKQKLSIADIKEIIRLSKEKYILFEMMKKCLLGHWLDKKKAIKYLKILAKKVTQVEYALQQTWKFKKNRKFHRFWELPHCSCPKMDNQERWGSAYHIINQSCILHGRIKKCVE